MVPRFIVAQQNVMRFTGPEDLAKLGLSVCSTNTPTVYDHGACGWVLVTDIMGLMDYGIKFGNLLLVYMFTRAKGEGGLQ